MPNQAVRQHSKCTATCSTALPLLLILLLGGAHGGNAARILMYPYPWPSCVFGLVTLANELAARGHQVLLVTPRELSGQLGAMLRRQPTTNSSGTSTHGADTAGGSVTELLYDSVSMDELQKVGDAGLIELVRMTADILFTSCANIFGNQTAVDALYDFGADVFIGDVITACSWIMSDILGLPRIDYNPGAGGPTVEAAMYHLSMPSLAYTPVFTSGLPPTGMNLPQRAFNALLMGVTRSFSVLLPIKSHIDMRRRVNTTWRNPEIPPPNPNRALLTLAGMDMGVELPRAFHGASHPADLNVPLPPPPPPPSPEQRCQRMSRMWARSRLRRRSHCLQTSKHSSQIADPGFKFFEGGRGAGVIVASFGTMLNASPSNLLAIATAFASLPQRVVWKVRDSDLTASAGREVEAIVAAAGNVLMLPWIPQQDLLGHHAVRVLLTHGGIHSIYEALFHGQPMVLMPLGIDQFDNARLVAEHHRAGRIVQQSSLAAGNTAQLVATLQQVIGEPSYRRQARQLSQRLRARPGTPASRAADWVGYALATGPDPFLWPLEVGMPWWQLHFVDVAAAAAACLAASCAAAWWSLRACRRYVHRARGTVGSAAPCSAQHIKAA